MGDKKNFEKYVASGDYHWRWFSGRKRSYRLHVLFLNSWVVEKDTLEIGAGDGLIVHALGLRRGVDNDLAGVKIAVDKGVAVDLGDAYCLPYRDKEFASVLMSDVLEHFSDISTPLQEARRVSKMFLYVAIPAIRIGEPDHYHFWLPEDLAPQVEKEGFELVESAPSENKRYYLKFKKV